MKDVQKRFTVQYLVKYISCHTSMAHPEVMDEGSGLPIWRLVTNVLNW